MLIEGNKHMLKQYGVGRARIRTGGSTLETGVVVHISCGQYVGTGWSLPWLLDG